MPGAPARGPRFIGFAIPFLGILGATQGSLPNISSTALVSVSRDLHMGSALVALTASIQTIAIAATVISTGLLADRIGRRRMLVSGLVLGLAGSIVAGLAPASAFYLLGQALIGVGLGAVYGAAFAYIRLVAEPGKLTSALGTFGAVVGGASMLLTFGAGTLVGVSWRLAFALVAVLIVALVLATPLVLPAEPPVSGTRADPLGQILLALGIVGFLYGVSQLGHSLTAPSTLLPLGGGVVLLVAFFVFEAKSPGAFYPVALFRSPLFIAAIFAGFVYNFGTAVGFLQPTNLWQYVTGVPTNEVAVWQVPLMAFGVLGAIITGRRMSKGLTNANAILLGAVVTAVGFVLLALVRDSHSFWMFTVALGVTGIGLTSASIPFGNLILKEAPPAQFGPVTSSRTTIGQFFYSLGFALSTIIVDRMTMGGVTHRLTDAGVQPDMVGTAVTSINQFVSTGTDPATELGKQALADAVDSYGSGFGVMMLITAGLILVAGIIGSLLARRGGADAATSPTAPPAAPAAASAS